MLRNLSIIFLCQISAVCFSQQIVFKGSVVDTLTITSGSWVYHFDDKGTTSGKADKWTVIFNEEKNVYEVASCVRTSFHSTFKPDTGYLHNYALQHKRHVNQQQLVYLFEQFSGSDTIATFENSGISENEFLKATRKKDVQTQLKRYRKKWDFFYYYDKKEREQTYADVQNKDTFNLFLATAFHLGQYTFITDVGDDIWVEISTDSTDYSYRGKIPDVFKQPFHDMNDPSLESGVLNLRINKTLVDLLPKRFNQLSDLETRALMNSYIVWLLKRKGVIY